MNSHNQKTSFQPNQSKGIPKIPWRLHLLICGIGLCIIFAMGYGFYLGNKISEEYSPLADAAMEIKLEATSAHLWFEEIVSGDLSEEIEVVNQHLGQAEWYATAMLEGGKTQERTFIPLKDTVLRSEIEKVIEKINTFREITEQRYKTIQESGTGTKIDQRYDATFHDFIDQVDRVRNKLQAQIATENQTYKIIQVALISIGFVLLGAIILFFHRFERRRSSDTQLISATNENLQKALQEVKALQGIIPICCYCKKIRDEEGLWNQLETYIHDHSEAEFSHGICPECYKKEIEEVEFRGQHM